MNSVAPFVVEKVGAFIIRYRAEGGNELLLFRHADMPEVTVQIPGGTVEQGRESIEEALYREVGEESGLQQLELIRKLGIAEFFWEEKRCLVKRHTFLLRTSVETPDSWTHSVGGKGEDHALKFSFYWLQPRSGFRLGRGLDIFLCREYLPELYPLTYG